MFVKEKQPNLSIKDEWKMIKTRFINIFFINFFINNIFFRFSASIILHGTAQSLLFELDQIKPRDFRSILQPAATVPAPALGFRLRRGHLGVPVSSAPNTNTHGSAVNYSTKHSQHFSSRTYFAT